MNLDVAIAEAELTISATRRPLVAIQLATMLIDQVRGSEPHRWDIAAKVMACRMAAGKLLAAAELLERNEQEPA